MSPLAANIIGIIGSVLFMGGFIYANRVEQIDKLLFNAINLAGAILLLISLSVHFNLAAVILETAWGLIALSGIIKALRERRKGSPS
ncbi:MAG: permease [Blastomonas sp. CACIA14H2]|uniref:CBU_0592 family membrane protein n=1 Tax=Blastomonas sp. CACIA14H2 TaxID=1419876 RepID=UPI0003CFD679|nr:MAG: permease [Blastomonas sp. CACIA14H2]